MEGIKYTELMGENVKDKLRYCGKNVRIYNLAKIINPQFAEIDDNATYQQLIQHGLQHFGVKICVEPCCKQYFLPTTKP